MGAIASSDAGDRWSMWTCEIRTASSGGLNVMDDLAVAMKFNPNLHIQLDAGYFDLATPFFEGIYEMQHLPIPDRLQANIETRQFESGHMVYAVEAQLHAIHDNVTDFIRRTSSGTTKTKAVTK